MQEPVFLESEGELEGGRVAEMMATSLEAGAWVDYPDGPIRESNAKQQLDDVNLTETEGKVAVILVRLLSTDHMLPRSHLMAQIKILTALGRLLVKPTCRQM